VGWVVGLGRPNSKRGRNGGGGVCNSANEVVVVVVQRDACSTEAALGGLVPQAWIG